MLEEKKMKKKKMFLVFGWAAMGAVLLATVLAGTACKSTEKSNVAVSREISAQAERDAAPAKIIDWSNRGIGEVADPQWLLPAVRGNWTKFKEDWTTIDSNKVLKYSVAENANLNNARTIADVQYAARLATELKQAILTRAAYSLDRGEFEVVNDAVTKTIVNIAGQERLTDFWQLREVDEGDGKKRRLYTCYVFYACDSAIWSQLTAKYLRDVIGKVPDSKAQKVIAGMFDELDEETKREREKSEEEFRVEVRARQEALNKGPLSAADQWEAYRSGDPARIAAASTTEADADYIAALSRIASQED